MISYFSRYLISNLNTIKNHSIFFIFVLALVNKKILILHLNTKLKININNLVNFYEF